MSRHLTALVIGNAAYEGSSKLKNAGNDADDVAATLDAYGYGGKTQEFRFHNA